MKDMGKDETQAPSGKTGWRAGKSNGEGKLRKSMKKAPF
jgi:hypothetical protein